MDELDMSKPGTELFPEQTQQQYNSYQDSYADQVDDPLDTGVTPLHVADQQNVSDKELNFKALRDEAARLKEEREYWKGQAEAFSKNASPQSQQQTNPYESLDWDDGNDVKKAFQSLKYENDTLRNEMKDALTALNTKSQHQDWDKMVTQNIPELTSKNPIFAEMIKNASNPYEAAYILSELNSKASSANLNQNTPSYGNRAMQNAQKPQTLASVGGRGQLSSADYYASMSDEDFIKIASKNMASI